MADSGDRRSCFVIMPFREKKDAARKDVVDFDNVYDNIIEPAVLALNEERGIPIECTRSDKIEQAGMIQERMIERIAEADVAVVDLTTANPNVYYELGVRHALRDRVTVLLRRHGTDNPFNIGGMTTIEYDLDAAAAERARTAITNFVANGLLSANKDSLVYSVLPGLKLGIDPKPITEGKVEDYAVPRATGKTVGIVSGDLREVNLGASLHERPIEVWVNSENINMQMARPYDRSISSLIRYLGARRDDTGCIVEDTIADELKAAMGQRQLVNPSEVVATGAGALGKSHRVRRIYHVASVYGVVGSGYHCIVGVEQCITNALARMDKEAQASESPDAAPKSILFPLLATNTARSDVIQNARRQIAAAIGYLRSRDRLTHIERVYFMAPNELLLAGLRVALAELKTRPIQAASTPVQAAATKAPAKRSRARKT